MTPQEIVCYECRTGTMLLASAPTYDLGAPLFSYYRCSSAGCGAEVPFDGPRPLQVEPHPTLPPVTPEEIRLALLEARQVMHERVSGIWGERPDTAAEHHRRFNNALHELERIAEFYASKGRS